jgi:hypothetical protein
LLFGNLREKEIFLVWGGPACWVKTQGPPKTIFSQVAKLGVGAAKKAEKIAGSRVKTIVARDKEQFLLMVPLFVLNG